MIVETQTRLDKGDDLFGINRGALESQIKNSREQITKLVDQEREILSILEGRQPVVAPAKEPLQITVTGGNPAPVAPTARGGGSASAMREQRDAAREVIAALEDELRALGMNEVEQRVNAELRRAGAGATDAQKASIRDLVMAIDAEGQAMQQMELAMEGAKGLAKDFLGGLIGDLRSGVDGATALANAFGRLADRLLDMALDGLLEPGILHVLRVLLGIALEKLADRLAWLGDLWRSSRARYHWISGPAAVVADVSLAGPLQHLNLGTHEPEAQLPVTLGAALDQKLLMLDVGVCRPLDQHRLTAPKVLAQDANLPLSQIMAHRATRHRAL